MDHELVRYGDTTRRIPCSEGFCERFLVLQNWTNFEKETYTKTPASR